MPRPWYTRPKNFTQEGACIVKMKQQRDAREIIISRLRERDGDRCMYPNCNDVAPLDFTIDYANLPQDDPRRKVEPTIDHWMPQSYGKANGWMLDEIWALTNLKLMHKKCNAKKGDRLPNEDGTLPQKNQSTFKFRRQRRAQRPEICTSCQSGRLLGKDEWCNSCGHGANPGRYPKWRQMNVKECDHDLFYCVSCTIWFPESRRSALDALMTGGPGYE